MYKITNISKLGTEFSVSDEAGNMIKTIQIIPHADILTAALGPYTSDFPNIKTYLDNSIAVLEGYDQIAPHSVLWYATSDEEIVLAELIQYAVNNGYDRIIVEHLDPLDTDM